MMALYSLFSGVSVILAMDGFFSGSGTGEKCGAVKELSVLKRYHYFPSSGTKEIRGEV